MRPGQNKRMRGRPTNNRRGPNPLTRSYESNGPDVKIRGNAHHVAEKYLQLARDAHTGGDPVAAENYLQHAEHYFRLIAAAQAAQALAQSGQQRPPGEAEEDLEDDSDFGALSDRFASPAERQNAYQQSQPGFQPQPSLPPNAPQPFGDRPAYEAERQGRRSRRLCPSARPSGQSFSGPGSATRSAVRRAQRGLSRQSARTRWSSAGVSALSRFSAPADERSRRRYGARRRRASLLHNRQPETQQHGAGGQPADTRGGSFADPDAGA